MKKTTKNSIVYTGRRMKKDPEVLSVRICVEYKDGSEVSYCSIAETMQRDLGDIKKAIMNISTPSQKGIVPKRKPVRKASKKKSSPKKKTSKKKR